MGMLYGIAILAIIAIVTALSWGWIILIDRLPGRDK